MKITLNKIKKTYGNKTILKGISWKFESGKIYVIKGISGCGKTTLLNILGRIDIEFEGEIDIETEQPMTVGYVFQKSLLLSSLTVSENLELISGNKDYIKVLCSEMGIQNLLERKTEDLSGGERQRISIARALLRCPDVLLCDEPTASLDYENSERVAELICEQRSAKRIIIIATHESFFDSYADEIIQLNYGVFREMKENNQSNVVKGMDEPGILTKTHDRSDLRAFKYVLKRHPRLLSFESLFPLVFTFLLCIVVTVVKVNFHDEASYFMKQSYPMDMIVYWNGDDKVYPEQLSGNTVLYTDYEMMEDGVRAFYLPAYDASIFKIKGMILEGNYPQTSDQILITPEYAADFLQEEILANAIGQEILFCGLSLEVSGVAASSFEEEALKNYNNDFYYRKKISGATLFIPYDTIAQSGIVIENEYQMASYPGLANDINALELLTEFRGDDTPNQYYANIREEQLMVERAGDIITMLLVFGIVIASVFMTSIVAEELFYRRKEIGYLQIFGVPKEKVSWLLVAEYCLKIVTALGNSFVLYILLTILYYMVFRRWVTAGIITAVMQVVGIAVYTLVAVYLAILFFLRKSILSLIV